MQPYMFMLEPVLLQCKFASCGLFHEGLVHYMALMYNTQTISPLKLDHSLRVENPEYLFRVFMYPPSSPCMHANSTPRHTHEQVKVCFIYLPYPHVAELTGFGVVMLENRIIIFFFFYFFK